MGRCPRRSEKSAGTDTFERRRGLMHQPLGCTYCGSMPAELALEWIRDGAEVTPTDKNYKIYLKYGVLAGKFYFQHLTSEQQDEFIELHNSGRMRMSYPGFFYTLPYFTKRVGDE